MKILVQIINGIMTTIFQTILLKESISNEFGCRSHKKRDQQKPKQQTSQISSHQNFQVKLKIE